MPASIAKIIKEQGESLLAADLTASGSDAAGAGDTFANMPGRLLGILNGNAGVIVVTVAKQQNTVPVPGHSPKTIADITLTIPIGEVGIMSIPEKGYNDTANSNLIDITYDISADVKVAMVDFL